MNLSEGLARYEHLPREEYFQKNQELSEGTWFYEDLPTVGDIAGFLQGEENPRMQAIFDFFENKNGFVEMANRQGAAYTEEESKAFIQSVMSSNNTDISKAGYFYKLLMASADDFTIVATDCGNPGVEWVVHDIEQGDWQYRIRYQWVNELKDYADGSLDEFKALCSELHLQKVHVRTPLGCTCFPHDLESSNSMKARGICSKCAGKLPDGVQNLGAFTTLMVTEHATQSALSSMNKGVKKDINDALKQGYPGPQQWEGIAQWIREVCEDLKGDKVFARFYEIALMSRVRYDWKGPFVTAMMSSINHSGNLFGSYIFAPKEKSFEKIVQTGSFEDNSLKLQIAMNQYKGGTPVSTFQLRDYQKRQLDFVENALQSASIAAVESPTGSGKTFVMLSLAKNYLRQHPMSNVCITTGFNNLVFLMEQRAEELGLDVRVLIGTRALNCPAKWEKEAPIDPRTRERIPFKPFTPAGMRCQCGAEHLRLDTEAVDPEDRVCPWVNKAYHQLLDEIKNSGGKLVVTNHSTFLAHQDNGTFDNCGLLVIDEAHTFGTYYDEFMALELEKRDFQAIDAAMSRLKPPMNMVIRKNIENGKALPKPQIDALCAQMDRKTAMVVREFFETKSAPNNFITVGENYGRIDYFYHYFDFKRPKKTVLFTATLDKWTAQMFNLARSNVYRERKQFCDYSKSEFVAIPRESFKDAFKEFVQYVDEKGLKHGLCLSTTIHDMNEALEMNGLNGYWMTKDLQEFERIVYDEPDRKVILCGSRALFQGIDIHGLEFVCLNKIPFPNYDEKQQKMNEFLQDKAGIDSWSGFTVPKTQNDMLQSSGRLWRDVDSHGVVSCFDPRVEKFQYMFKYVFCEYRNGINMLIKRGPRSKVEPWEFD